MSKKIEVRAGESVDSIALVEERDSVADARTRARYIASRDFARLAEMSEPFAFVGVYVDGTLRA